MGQRLTPMEMQFSGWMGDPLSPRSVPFGAVFVLVKGGEDLETEDGTITGVEILRST